MHKHFVEVISHRLDRGGHIRKVLGFSAASHCHLYWFYEWSLLAYVGRGDGVGNCPLAPEARGRTTPWTRASLCAIGNTGFGEEVKSDLAHPLEGFRHGQGARLHKQSLQMDSKHSHPHRFPNTHLCPSTEKQGGELGQRQLGICCL